MEVMSKYGEMMEWRMNCAEEWYQFAASEDGRAPDIDQLNKNKRSDETK